jgi:branched-chain amino acid transport system ATP-binding protein
MRFGGLTALDRISLRVAPGEIVGLIGPNGSGKTTLFNVIGGSLRPTAGRITFAGEEITGLGPHRICRRGIGRAFQVASPFWDLTAAENVTVGCLFGRPRRRPAGREARAEVRELLEFVGLAARAQAPVRQLSLGELKRLEVAMALATRPRLLLLDEVLAGLSPAGAAEIMGLLKRARDRGATLFLIEHLVRAISQITDRVIVLDRGRVIAEGRPEEIVGHPQVIEAYLGER